jgi:cytochrome c oxidase subunit 1
MFVTGQSVYAALVFSVLTFIVAIPSAVKVFNWTATMYKGSVSWETPMLYVAGFIGLFAIGGLTGLFLAAMGLNIHVTDTYFIVAHIHFVLFAGSVFTIFAGIYHWYPKITGRMYDRRLGRWHFWLTLLGTWGTFLPMHWIGMEGMPRRVSDYAAQFGDWNLAISLFGFLLGLAQLIFLYNMVVSWRWGPKATANPWRALSIEWQVSSPPPRFNFPVIPRVVGGPYEFGMPGARHVIMRPDRELPPTRQRAVAAGQGHRA